MNTFTDCADQSPLLSASPLSGVAAQQASIRLEHRLLCIERAIERCDYDAANVFAAQAAYYSRVLSGEPMTAQNRNEIVKAVNGKAK